MDDNFGIVKFRDYSYDNKIRFIDEFNGLNVEIDDGTSNSLNFSFSNFYNTFFKIYNRCMPIKCKTFKRLHSSSPWMTPDLKFCIYKKYKLLKLDRNGRLSRGDFNKYKNILNVTIKQAKELFYLRKFMQHNKDVKKTWNLVNSLLNRTKSNKDLVLSNENNQVLEGKQLSNFINNYYSNITVRLGLMNLNLNNVFMIYVTPVLFSFYAFMFMRPSAENEVLDLICSLPLKGTHLDDIPSKILKLVAKPLSFWLSKFYNCFIDKGLYPSILKMARVIPIHKGGNLSSVSNYRPISTLLSVNKIFEKLTYNRINDFVEKNNILSNCQHGFTKGSNTTIAILKLVSYLLSSLNNKIYCLCVFGPVKGLRLC